jgi:hypothetical protein
VSHPEQPSLPFRRPKRPRPPPVPRVRLRMLIELLPSDVPPDVRKRRAIKALLRWHGFEVLSVEEVTM